VLQDLFQVRSPQCLSRKILKTRSRARAFSTLKESGDRSFPIPRTPSTSLRSKAIHCGNGANCAVLLLSRSNAPCPLCNASLARNCIQKSVTRAALRTSLRCLRAVIEFCVPQISLGGRFQHFGNAWTIQKCIRCKRVGSFHIS